MVILVNRENDPIRYAIEEIKQVYLKDNRPWIIGYSGGKDSTTVAELVFQALLEIPEKQRKKDIHITCSNTMVENPLIMPIIDEFMVLVSKLAQQFSLPIFTHIHKPKIEESFWVLLIGQGYPPPLQNFRWCTDRLKIKPSNEFILNQVSEHGEVVILLGVRKDESTSRQISIERNKIVDKLLRRHPYLSNACVYGPIEDFTFDVVWEYLLTNDERWLDFNKKLYDLYSDSSGEEECPYVVDETTRPCGNSRFGCWVCTLVTEDRSLKGFLDSNQLSDETKNILEKMISFRENLLKYRSNRDMRLKRRKTGHIYYIEKDGEKLKGLGPFTLKARKRILKELLMIQKEIKENKVVSINSSLIEDKELKLIRSIWIEEGEWEDKLPKIYKDVFGKKPDWVIEDLSLFEKEELDILDNISNEYNINVDVIKKLINIERKYLGYAVRTNIMKAIHKLLFQDWISKNTEEEI